MDAPRKKAKIEMEGSAVLGAFKSWLNTENIIVDSKVSINEEKCCARYGLIANEDIPEGTSVLIIPRNSLLTPETGSISDLLAKEKEALESKSGWVPLMIALISEYTNDKSRWQPYLDLFSNSSELSHPMFWKVEEIENELKGTGIVDLVKQDLSNMKQEFNEIVLPFIKSHSERFSHEDIDEDLYKTLVGFVMAYSFTEPATTEDDEFTPSSPIMVPLADVLNHISKNNASLNFGKENLEMVATKAIKKGEEIFNTYGELSNSQLLHMYGFSEKYPENEYEAVEIPMKLLLDTYKESISEEHKKEVDVKWRYLEDLELVSLDGVYAIGPEGVLTEEELFHSLKVLHMNMKDFEEHQEKEGWSEDEGDSENLSNDLLINLPETWKLLLLRVLQSRAAQYSTSLEEEESLMLKEDSLTLHQKYALYVRHSQKKIIQNMITILESEKS